MINMTRQVKITAPGRIPQFLSGTVTYNKDYFYVNTVSLKQMYIQKYKKKYYQGPINTFKAVIY